MSPRQATGRPLPLLPTLPPLPVDIIPITDSQPVPLPGGYDARARGGSAPREVRLVASTSGLGTVVPVVYGTRKVAGHYMYSVQGAGAITIAWQLAEGEVGAVSTILLNDADISGLGWVNSYTSYLGTTSQTPPVIMGSVTEGYPGLAYVVAQINTATGEAPGWLTLAATTTGRKVYPFRAGGANAVSSNPIEHTYDLCTSEECLDIASASLDTGSAKSWNNIADWCDKLMADDTKRWPCNIVVSDRSGWSAVAQVLKHAFVEPVVHAGLIKLVARKPPEQYCLYFAGTTSNYATLPNHANLAAGADTSVEFWSKSNEAFATAGYLFSKGNNFAVYYTPSSYTYTVEWQDGTATPRSVSWAIPAQRRDGNWIYHALQWDVDGVTFRWLVGYGIKGSIETATSNVFGASQFPAADASAIYLGMKSTTANAWKGWLGKISFWSQGDRSASDIEADWTTRLTGSETNLEGYWQCDEGTGTTLTDDGPNSQNGTVSGASYVTRHIPVEPPDASLAAIITIDDWIEEPRCIQIDSDIDVVSVNYTDGSGWDDASLEHYNPSGVTVGSLKRTEHTLEGCTAESPALRWAGYNWALLNYGSGWTWTGTVNTKAANLLKYDVVKISTREGLTDRLAVVMRCDDLGGGRYAVELVMFSPLAYPEQCAGI